MRIVANYEESLNNVSSQLKQSFYCFDALALRKNFCKFKNCDKKRYMGVA